MHPVKSFAMKKYVQAGRQLAELEKCKHHVGGLACQAVIIAIENLRGKREALQQVIDCFDDLKEKEMKELGRD